MALYIDGRFAVSGRNSHLNLQNPISVTDEVIRLLTELNCCLTGSLTGGQLPGNAAPATPWNPIRVPKPLAGKTLDTIEIQVEASPDGDTGLTVSVAETNFESVIPQGADKLVLENLGIVVEEDDLVTIDVTSEATTPATGYITYFKFV